MTDDFAFTYEKVSVAEAKDALKGPEVNNEKCYAHLRKQQDQPQIKLEEATVKWILSLPTESRPLALAKKYPRIANILAKAWPLHGLFAARLDEYMLDNRPSRQGFPADVAVDFLKLKQHFDKVDTRVKTDVWNLTFK